MPFRFSRRRALEADVARIARKQAEKAVSGLRAGETDAEGIHVARTSTKRLRGLLRLLKPELGGRFGIEERNLSKVQKALGPLRDNQVLLETFDEVFGSRAKRARARALPDALASIRAELEARVLAERLDGEVQDRVAVARSELSKVGRRAKAWAPRHTKREGGFGAIERGLEATYRRARKARDEAYREGTAEAFHDWRKAVKYHGHHLRLLSPIEPDRIGRRLRDNERLGDLLGKDHDLAVLDAVLVARASAFESEQKARSARSRVAGRQQNLRRRAEPLGKRLFAETPAAFRRRVRAWFRAWRKGGAPATARA
jgi:CHAD domain-containing protein